MQQESTKVLSCDCVSENQDKIHGKGKRLFNVCKPAKAPEKWYRCTVCKKEVQG